MNLVYKKYGKDWGPRINKFVGAVKESARARKISWELDSLFVAELIQKPCVYCGDSPKDFPNDRNGLDRIDPNIGYNIDNVVSCCYNCNVIKSNYNIEKFKSLVIKIYKFNKNENF